MVLVVRAGGAWRGVVLEGGRREVLRDGMGVCGGFACEGEEVRERLIQMMGEQFLLRF